MTECEDIDNIKDDAKNMVEKVIRSISKSSNTRQLMVGTGSGVTTGFIAMKIGRTAAFAIGGGILLLQVAQSQGYIRVDWDKIRRNVAKTSETVENRIGQRGPSWVDEVRKFINKNSCFAGGFLGGFFIGIAL